MMTYTAVLPEVGPIHIRHTGPDIDIIHIGDGRVLPGLVDIPNDVEDWCPAVYAAALAGAGWRITSDWEPGPNAATDPHTATVEPMDD